MDFVFDRGSYQSSKNIGEAFDLFLDKVKEIQTQVDAIDEVQAEVTGSTNGAGKPAAQPPEEPKEPNGNPPPPPT